jgi:hypothetical protein
VGKSLYRVLLIIPWAVPAYITALTWRGMFDYEYGAINLVISQLFLAMPMVNWLGLALRGLPGLHPDQHLAGFPLHDGDHPGRPAGHSPGALRGRPGGRRLAAGPSSG